MNIACKSIAPALLVLTMSSAAIAQAPVTDLGSPQRRSAPNSNTVNNGYPADTYPADVRPIENSSVIVEQERNYRSENTAPSSVAIERSNVSGGSSLQQLQEEVAALRGQIEEQNHAIQQIRQQHSDDMAAMDRRLGAGASTTSTASPQTPGNAGNSVATPAASTSAMTNEGKAEYEMAYGKLKAKDYDGAIAGFKSQIAQYPNSEYSGNSHFWLGFIYQTKGDSTTAAKSFSTLIDKFPSHAKTPDAKYNLGKIYHQQGNTAKAKELLKDVASGTSKSAPLAKSYLESL